MKYFFLLFILSFSIFAQTDKDNLAFVIKVSKIEEKTEVMRVLKKNKVIIKAVGEKFIVVSPENLDEKTLSHFQNILKSIKRINSNIKISKDYYLKPQFNNEELACKLRPLSSSLVVDAEVSNILTVVQPCTSTSLKCNGQSIDWAPKVLGADLAEEIVRNEVVKSIESIQLSKTAVIDTGFDVINQSSGLLVTVTTELADSESRDKDNDDGGHGTNVAGMIAGKNTGVTAHTELSVYKISQGRTGRVGNGVIAAAIEKACKDNNDIVNVSWGSEKDELEEINPKEELWYEVASRLGCIIIKSSGNSGIRRKRGTSKIDISDPFLTVAALDRLGELASFSTSGQVAAPGKGVFSLLSNDYIYGENTKKNSCNINDNNFGSINGTSFSSPAVAGVAAQVVTILRARNEIPDSPSDKIKLIKSILIASQSLSNYNSGVNSLAATLIAKSVTRENANSSIENLVQIGRSASSDICQKEDKCPGLNCEEKRSCSKNLREKSLVCQLSLKDRITYIKSLSELNELNLLSGWASKFTDIEIANSTELQDIFSDSFFDNILSKSENIEEQAYLLSTLTFQKRSDWESRVKDFLNQNPLNDVNPLLLSDNVKKMPEWSSWITIVAGPKKDNLSIEYLTDAKVQELPEYDLWVENFLLRNEDPFDKIELLRNSVTQKSKSWKRWADALIQYIQNGDYVTGVLDFILEPEILAHKDWEEFANKFWNQASNSKKIEFIRDSRAQTHSSWAKFAKKVIVNTENIDQDSSSLLGAFLATQKVQELPEWNSSIQRFMSNEHSGYKEFLLTDPAVQELEDFDKWLASFFDNNDNSDFSLARVLNNPRASQHPMWANQIKMFIEKPGLNWYKVDILVNSQVQLLPEWDKWIDAEFEKDELGFQERKLIDSPNLREHARWTELAEKFLKRANPSFVADFLLDARVQALPGWSNAVDRLLSTSNESISITNFLSNEEISSSPSWNQWVLKALRNQEFYDERKLLSEGFALRHPKWFELSLEYINTSGDDQDKADFLQNEYVKKKAEWKHLVEEFLESSQDQSARAILLQIPEVQALDLASVRNN
ncbi:MAG: S8 family peptidase [bacterium]